MHYFRNPLKFVPTNNRSPKVWRNSKRERERTCYIMHVNILAATKGLLMIISYFSPATLKIWEGWPEYTGTRLWQSACMEWCENYHPVCCALQPPTETQQRTRLQRQRWRRASPSSLAQLWNSTRPSKRELCCIELYSTISCSHNIWDPGPGWLRIWNTARSLIPNFKACKVFLWLGNCRQHCCSSIVL